MITATRPTDARPTDPPAEPAVPPAAGPDEARWPLLPEPVPDERLSLWDFYYLHSCPPPRDPTMVWGTDVDCAELQTYLKRVNATSDVLVTPAHVLVAATARAMTLHPRVNRRVIKRKVREFREVGIAMPFQKKTEVGVDVTLFEQVDRKSVADIAAEAWRTASAAARGGTGIPEPRYMRFPRWLQARLLPFHVWLVNNFDMPVRETNKRQRKASVLVNYFGTKGMAPLRSYKPSRLPYDVAMTSVTMGAIEPRPVALNGEVVVRSVAPLFVRTDHRLVDAHELGRFTETIRKLLADPASLDVTSADQSRDRQETVRPSVAPVLTRS